MPLCTATPDGAFAVRDARLVSAYVFGAVHLECVRLTHYVDGITSSAARLAADGAITAHEWVGRMRVKAEADNSAMAGSFQLHFSTPFGLSITQICAVAFMEVATQCEA